MKIYRIYVLVTEAQEIRYKNETKLQIHKRSANILNMYLVYIYIYIKNRNIGEKKKQRIY
jgi:hypothetical protein